MGGTEVLWITKSDWRGCQLKSLDIRTVHRDEVTQVVREISRVDEAQFGQIWKDRKSDFALDLLLFRLAMIVRMVMMVVTMLYLLFLPFRGLTQNF